MFAPDAAGGRGDLAVSLLFETSRKQSEHAERGKDCDT